MPFKSKSQQRFMFAAESRGDLPKGTAKRWAEHTPDIGKLPEKKHKSRSEKKAEFVNAFVSNFYAKLDISKEAAAKSPMVDALRSAVITGLNKVAAAAAPVGTPSEAAQAVSEAAKTIRAVVKDKPSVVNEVALGVGAPFVLGGLAGAGLSRLFSPSQYEISNLQKQELLAQYDNAINEIKRRIATRG